MTPEEIRTLRKRLDMTQREFASALEVDRASVSQWETGTTRPTKTKEEILRFWRRRLDEDERSADDWKSFAVKAGSALGVAVVLDYIRES